MANGSSVPVEKRLSPRILFKLKKPVALLQCTPAKPIKLVLILTLALLQTLQHA